MEKSSSIELKLAKQFLWIFWETKTRASFRKRLGQKFWTIAISPEDPHIHNLVAYCIAIQDHYWNSIMAISVSIYSNVIVLWANLFLTSLAYIELHNLHSILLGVAAMDFQPSKQEAHALLVVTRWRPILEKLEFFRSF